MTGVVGANSEARRRPRLTVSRVMVVEAESRLVWHPRRKDGRFPGFREYRPWDAVGVK